MNINPARSVILAFLFTVTCLSIIIFPETQDCLIVIAADVVTAMVVLGSVSLLSRKAKTEHALRRKAITQSTIALVLAIVLLIFSVILLISAFDPIGVAILLALLIGVCIMQGKLKVLLLVIGAGLLVGGIWAILTPRGSVGLLLVSVWFMPLIAIFLAMGILHELRISLPPGLQTGKHIELVLGAILIQNIWLGILASGLLG